MDNLKHQVVHGLKWSLLAKISTQLFSWASTFMVIRMLTPDDYGVMALAMVFFSFISVVANAGLVSALVVQQRIEQQAASQIFTLSLILNVSLSIALALVAPIIARWYQNDALCHVLWVLSAVNPLLSLTIVPQAEMQVAMRFKAKSLIESVSGLLSAAVALICAYFGYAYWALVAASVTLLLVRVVGLYWLTTIRARITLQWHGAKEMILYAWNAQLGAVVWFAYDKADSLILARTLGVGPAGVYNVANEMSAIPMSKISGIMNEVAFSAFAKTKHDAVAAAGYLKKALRLMAVVAFPVLYGMGAVASEAIPVLLGEHWMQAGAIVLFLSLALPFRMCHSVLGNYCAGMGEAKFGRQNVFITAIILVSSIAVGAQYGLEQTAIAWSIGYTVNFFILLYRYHSKFSLPWSTLLNFLPVWGVSAVMLIALLLLTPWLHLATESLLMLLIIKVALGASVVTPILWHWHGKELRGLFQK